MKLTVNGKDVELEAATVLDAVKHFGLEHKMVMVELAGEVIDRERWEQTRLMEGQRMELVHFVGGG